VEEVVMRRTLLAALVAAVAVLPSTAQAAPSPQIVDKKGDWAVDAQDILTARVSSVLVAGKPALRAEMSLAAAPSAVPATYRFGFMKGCVGYGFSYDWKGTATGSTAQFFRQECYTGAEKPGETPKTTTLPATATVKGATLTWTTPFAAGIARGARVTDFFAWVYDVPFGTVGNDTVTGYTEFYTGDVAYSRATYVVGSDLPRR
jgi:hypothetical protein